MGTRNHANGLTFVTRAHTMRKRQFCTVRKFLTDCTDSAFAKGHITNEAMSDRANQSANQSEHPTLNQDPTAIVMGAEEARREWRTVVDTVLAGEDVIVERYSRPTVAVIAYDDYAAIRHELETLRAQRRSEQLRAAWKQGRIKTLPWESTTQQSDLNVIEGSHASVRE